MASSQALSNQFNTLHLLLKRRIICIGEIMLRDFTSNINLWWQLIDILKFMSHFVMSDHFYKIFHIQLEKILH